MSPLLVKEPCYSSLELANALFPDEEWIPTEPKFRYGYKQGAKLLENCEITKKHSVFVRLLSDIPINAVKAQIAGELKYRFDEGHFICFYEQTKELYIWTYSELRAIIGT